MLEEIFAWSTLKAIDSYLCADSMTLDAEFKQD